MEALFGSAGLFNCSAFGDEVLDSPTIGCHCHPTYNLLFELKFHSNQVNYFLATGCVAVTYGLQIRYLLRIPWQAISHLPK